MDNRIAIEIELRGKEVLSELKSIEDILNNLNKKTYKVTLSDAGGVGKILLKMQEILEAIKLVNNTPISPKADTSGLDRMAASARKANAEIQAMVRSMTTISNTPLLSGRVMTDWFSFPNGVIAGGARGMAEMWRNTMDTFNSYLWSTLSQSMSVASFSSLAQNVGAWLHNWPLLTHSGLFGDLYNLASQNRLLTGTSRLALTGNSWATRLLTGGNDWRVFSAEQLFGGGQTRSNDWAMGLVNAWNEARSQLHGPFMALTGYAENLGEKLDDINEFRLDPEVTESITEGLNPLQKWSQNFFKISDTLSTIGSTLYAGSNLFGQIASFGFGQQVDTVISTLTSQFTSSVTDGISNAFTRYDVFIKYPRIMEAFGIQIAESSEALTKLNDAVLGLPTSLNDIASSATDFVAILSGLGYEGTALLDRSTDLAIAVNNAVLASGASDSDAQYAIQQLQNLIGTGGLTAIQWRSLRRTIPVALSEISKELGYPTWVEMRNAFTAGEVSVEQFTDALIKLGTDGGVLEQLADISKLTFEAISANFRNAFSRLIAGRVNENGEVEGGLLGTFNQLTMERYGEQLPQYIKNRIIPRIDAFASRLESGIINHQDEIFNFIDRVLAYDWEGLIAKIAKFTALKWDLILKIFEKIPEALLVFASVGAEPLSKILRFLGSLAFLGAGLSSGTGNIFARMAKNVAGGDLGWSLAEGAPLAGGSSMGAWGATFGGAGYGSFLGLLLYAIGEQAVLWGKAMEGDEVYRNITGIGRSQRDTMNQGSTFNHAWWVLDVLETLTNKEIISDAEEQRIKDFVTYLNDLLPEVDIKWDDIVQKVKINGQYINDSVGYLRTHLEVQKEVLDLQDIINKKVSTEANLRELVASKQTQTSALESLFEQYGEKYGITSDMSAETIATLPGVPTWVSMQFATAMANLSETDRQLKLIRDDMIALDNLEKMLLPEWKNMVKEYRETYGEIPEEVMDMIREGEVVIPSEIEILATLCQRVMEENSIADPVEDAVTEIPTIIENGRTNARQKAAELGEDIKGAIVLGASSGLSASLFNSIIDQVTSAINSARSSVASNVDYWTDNSDPMRGFGEAFGGRVQRIGGNSGDTILTWLSPGEYVLRKHAVDKIGLDFLNKLNTFNFSGALDSLTQRVGSGMSPYAFAGATANNTRIYNNNAQANITVNNSSQEFTQRRASKWIRGLN